MNCVERSQLLLSGSQQFVSFSKNGPHPKRINRESQRTHVIEISQGPDTKIEGEQYDGKARYCMLPLLYPDTTLRVFLTAPLRAHQRVVSMPVGSANFSLRQIALPHFLTDNQ